MQPTLKSAIEALQSGGVIAYPTEGVYGLGCDPDCKAAVEKILQLKQRDVKKGLIVITDQWSRVQDWVAPMPDARLQEILATWPGPITWVLPKSDRVPFWVSGEHNGVAIRVTAHPLARELCQAFQKPIISTSANPQSLPPAKTATEVKNYFQNQIEFILDGKVGDLAIATPMRDAMSGKILRS